ncbi:MAG: sigma-70 family RNA polymerase sigma factor [Bacteroidia bacterium]|nr:sigma-70 family RNA polymerase sigma factor [Bacteroidia bacterium]
MRFFQPLYEHCSDEELMKLIAEHDERGFDELYRRYADRMLHYFWRMFYHDEEKAQDFVQDIFVKIVEKPHLFHPEKRFSTWIYSVASNMVKNEYRSREVRKIITTMDDMSRIPVAETLDETALDRQKFIARLEDELENLSENHREVFVLRYQEELSIKEIGEVMGCSEGTIKSRIFYCLQKLANGLKTFDPGK